MKRTLPEQLVWPRIRHTIRHLPHVPARVDDRDAILAATVDDARPAAVRPGRGWSFAAAATVAVAACGTWLWSGTPSEPVPTDAELARLDAEVEEVFGRIGLVFRETERIALNDVLGADSATSLIDTDPEVTP